MQSKSIILISECISHPFDEGLKNVLYNLINSVAQQHDALFVTKKTNNTNGLRIIKIKLNKLFLNIELYSLIKRNSPSIVMYVPEASGTFNSFLRARILKFMDKNSTVVMISVQHRTYSMVQSFLISVFLRPDLLLLLSRKNEVYYQKRGINVKILPPAVDSNKFAPPKKEEKETIRRKYDMPLNKKIVLHVGHIKVDRNIECLMEVQKLKGTHVVIVGSTSFSVDDELKGKLSEAGVSVIDDFIPDISEIYKMSDIYVFPVISNLESIDMPMSVLEAMACNLPVITTRFGGLTDCFEEDGGFKYFNSVEELIRLIKDVECTGIRNAEKVGHFSWDDLTQQLIGAVGESR